LKKIKDSLSKAGVELTYTDSVNLSFGVPSRDVNSDTITVKFGVTPPKQSDSLGNLKKLIGGKDSNVNNIPSWKVEYPNSIIQFANNGRLYQFTSDGKNLTKKEIGKLKMVKL